MTLHHICIKKSYQLNIFYSFAVLNSFVFCSSPLNKGDLSVQWAALSQEMGVDEEENSCLRGVGHVISYRPIGSSSVTGLLHYLHRYVFTAGSCSAQVFHNPAPPRSLRETCRHFTKQRGCELRVNVAQDGA